MFLFNLFFRLSREKQLPFYSPNLKSPKNKTISPAINHDFCFGPVREFRTDRSQFNDNVSVHRIFQVRDPRDILISQYYSFGWSHTDQDFNDKEAETRKRIREQSIDEYVLEPLGAAHYLKLRYAPLVKRIKDGTQTNELTILTYEEMVTNFPSWLKQAIQPFAFNRFGIRSRAVVQAKYQYKYRNEFQPENSAKAHKRNVLPGEHRHKLKPETIKVLTEYFEDCLTPLGYHSASGTANVA